MSLRCMVCGHGVDDGLNICVFCHNGYTSQLACAVCGRPVDRGRPRAGPAAGGVPCLLPRQP